MAQIDVGFVICQLIGLSPRVVPKGAGKKA